jgi:YidC/Oxa1 family membrane protein insertase
MQDQGKRLLVAVALALAVMFAWQTFFAPKDEPQKPDAADPAAPQHAGDTPAPSGTSGTSSTSGTSGGLAPAQPLGPEQTIKLEFANLDVTFSSYGGVIKSWHLNDPRYKRDKMQGDLLPCGGERVDDAEPPPQCRDRETGAFLVNFAGSTYVLPQPSEWTGEKVSDREIVYRHETAELAVEKRFVVVPEAYLVKTTITVRAKPGTAEARQTLVVSAFGFQDPKDDGGGGQSIAPRRWESATFRGETHLGTTIDAVQKQPRFEPNIRWSGFEHPYMLVAFAPRPAQGLTVDKQTVAVGNEGLMRTDLLFRPEDVLRGDGAPLVREVVAYMGPKNYAQLEQADGIAGFPTAFKETIDLGWFGFIGRPLMWLLLKFYGFFLNWGLAIVLLTIVVKSITIPFTTKSMRSMKAMAVLAPQMKELQAKYKDDRQRLQMETMALYKQHGANPLTGCLPLLLQMPIWLALYRALSSTGELYQQPFIRGWIDDLTHSDPYYVLPIVLMVTMFLQARLTPMGPATDATQKLQQRMMQFGLPLMFGVMAFFFPAGLTLYIFTNTILSALHSIYMNKFDKKSMALQAKIKAAQAAAEQQKTAAAAAKAKPANPAKTATEDSGSDSSSTTGATRPAVRPGGTSRAKRKKRKR